MNPKVDIVVTIVNAINVNKCNDFIMVAGYMLKSYI
jgi:hypothetical protein